MTFHVSVLVPVITDLINQSLTIQRTINMQLSNQSSRNQSWIHLIWNHGARSQTWLSFPNSLNVLRFSDSMSIQQNIICCLRNGCHDSGGWAVDSGDLWALVFLDLSAAFDTVDYGILLEVLHKRFAVEGDALQWFESDGSNSLYTCWRGYFGPIRFPLWCPSRICGRSDWVCQLHRRFTRTDEHSLSKLPPVRWWQSALETNLGGKRW